MEGRRVMGTNCRVRVEIGRDAGLRKLVAGLGALDEAFSARDWAIEMQ